MGRKNAENAVPKYVRLKMAVCSRIEDGTLAAHGRVPSITELCREFSVSKITAQRALSDLVREGVLYRKAGVGTFATEAGTQHGGVRGNVLTWMFIVTRFRSDTYHYHEVLEGLTEAGQRGHVDVVLSATGNDPAVYEQRIDRAMARNVNGLVIAPPTRSLVDPRVLVKLQAGRVPVVSCNRPIAGLDCPGVLIDPVEMGRLAGRHFASMGRQRVAHFASYRYSVTEACVLGLRLGLSQGGVHLDADRVRFGDDDTYPLSDEKQQEQVAAFCEANRDMDAALMSSSMAVMLIAELTRRGRRVPDDVAVISVTDNATRLAESEIPVTAVGMDQRQIGHLIGEMLLRMAGGETLAARDSTTVAPRLVVRRSAP